MTSRPRPRSHDFRAMALVAGLAAGIAPAEGAAPSAPPSAPDLRTARVVDLSHPFDERTLYWPTAPSGFKLERLHFGQTDGGFFYSAYAFCAPEPGAGRPSGPPRDRDRRRGGGRRRRRPSAQRGR